MDNLLWELSPTVSNRRTMSSSGEQSVSVEAPSTGTGLGVPGTVMNRIMESFQGVLRGKSIIEAEPPEV